MSHAINPLDGGLVAVDTRNAIALLVITADPHQPQHLEVQHCGRGDRRIVACALRQVADELDPRGDGPFPPAPGPSPLTPFPPAPAGFPTAPTVPFTRLG